MPAPKTLELRGERVVLRVTAPEDAPTLRAVHSEPEVCAWWNLPGEHWPFDDDPETVYLTMWLEGEIAGFIQFTEEPEPEYRHASIDIFVAPAHHRQGLASDAMRTVIRHLVAARGHHRILIDPAADNRAAIACYEKAGFQPVGVMHSAWRDLSGRWRDVLLLELVERTGE